MNYWKRLIVTCALLAGILAACGGTTTNNAPAEDQVNQPQSGSPTTNPPDNAEPAVATGRAGVQTAVSDQIEATVTVTVSP